MKVLTWARRICEGADVDAAARGGRGMAGPSHVSAAERRCRPLWGPQNVGAGCCGGRETRGRRCGGSGVWMPRCVGARRCGGLENVGAGNVEAAKLGIPIRKNIKIVFCVASNNL